MALIRPTTTSHPASDSPDLAELGARLRHADPHLRRQAARDLAGFAQASTLLAERLQVEEQRSVLEALLTSLATLADATAVHALLDCLRSEDAALRNDAIETLKSAGQGHPQLIREALGDSDADVRILAIGILESLRHPDIEAWLIERLDLDEHLNVCACAVDLLCELGSERAVPALERCRARFADEPYLHFAIDLALQRLQGDPQP